MIGFLVVASGVLAFAVCMAAAIGPAIMSAKGSREMGE